MKSVLALRPVWPLRRMLLIQSILFNCGLITAGSIIFAIGMKSVIVPQGLLSGGVFGIALLLHYLHPATGLGWIYFLLNIPLVVLGWFHVGRRFMAYSIFGMVFCSWVVNVINTPPIIVHDPILGAVMAGIICGIGGGVILRSLGSAGGLDIIVVYLNKRFGLKVGMVISVANSVVLLAGCYFFGLERTLYSIVYVYASSRTIDAIISGFNRRKVLFVVSDQARSIADAILHKANRGVTFLKGEGAYTGTGRDVIFTVISMTELPKMKDLILDIDPNAFVVINDTMEVLGNRHGKRKIY